MKSCPCYHCEHRKDAMCICKIDPFTDTEDCFDCLLFKNCKTSDFKLRYASLMKEESE